MSRESSLWSWLAGARKELGPALQIQRIENSVVAGTPDVEGHLRLKDCAGQFWLELKSEERPARPSTPVRFDLRNREAQIEFMRHRWELGGNAFWFLQVGSGSDRRLFLAAGSLGSELRSGLTESELAVHCCNTGFFPRPISPQVILKRAITCRNSLSLMQR